MKYLKLSRLGEVMDEGQGAFREHFKGPSTNRFRTLIMDLFCDGSPSCPLPHRGPTCEKMKLLNCNAILTMNIDPHTNSQGRAFARNVESYCIV